MSGRNETPVSNRDSYLLGSRTINHDNCVRGSSGVWYPNFGAGVEIFGWAHKHAISERAS